MAAMLFAVLSHTSHEFPDQRPVGMVVHLDLVGGDIYRERSRKAFQILAGAPGNGGNLGLRSIYHLAFVLFRSVAYTFFFGGGLTLRCGLDLVHLDVEFR